MPPLRNNENLYLRHFLIAKDFLELLESDPVYNESELKEDLIIGIVDCLDREFYQWQKFNQGISNNSKLVTDFFNSQTYEFILPQMTKADHYLLLKSRDKLRDALSDFYLHAASLRRQYGYALDELHD